MHILTQLQKLNCPAQIVKSGENSPQINVRIIGYPEGLQFYK